MSLLPATHTVRSLGWLLVAAGAAMPAQAIEFSTSGFATLAVGRTSGACSSGGVVSSLNEDCTRFVADWSHKGVYQSSWSAQPESRIGLQGTAKMSEQFSATGQLMSRPLKDQQAKLEWLYLTYQPAPEWTIQAGRKRLPLYYYSDFQDVGYAYNLVRPTPDVYGWDIVNYNGVSVSHTATVAGWSLRTEALFGQDSTSKNKLLEIFIPSAQKVSWKGITSVNAEFSRDWFTGRLSYTQFRYKQVDEASGTVLFDGGAKHRLLGLALNADIDDWIVRSEFGVAKRPSTNFHATFYLANVGYRLGDFTLTGGTSNYTETLYESGDPTNRHQVLTAAVRYEVHKGGALKLQLDSLREHTPTTPLLGNSRLVTATYDVTF
jgi:hypothetical protein